MQAVNDLNSQGHQSQGLTSLTVAASSPPLALSLNGGGDTQAHNVYRRRAGVWSEGPAAVVS